jgi:hypothetical protein
MTRFYLGSFVALCGLTGTLLAQPAVPITTKAYRPAFIPEKAPPIRQVKADGAPASAPAVTPAPAPMPGPAVAGPTPGSMPNGCPPAIAADVAAACGEPAGSCANACDCLCGPPGTIWFGAEYLLWTTKGNRLPPLATTNLPGDTSRVTAGTLPNSPVLIGNRNYNDDWRSGFRIYGGLWLDQCQRIGVEGDYFYLGNSRTREVAGSDGTQIIMRPFTDNVQNGVVVAPFQNTQLVSFPGVLAGQVAVDTLSEFTGAGVNTLLNLCCSPCGRLDFLIGYRYLNLNDTLLIREDLQTLNPAGTTFVVQDRFRTENHFHGVNLGVAWERRFGNMFIGTRATVGLGNTHTIVDIDGSTTRTQGGVTDTAVGGLLAQPSNIGRYELNKFAVVPEVGVRLGVQLTNSIRIYGGYNFLYWSNVIRTGDVVDLRVNSSQIPTFPRGTTVGELFPRFTPRYTDFWAHGVVIGLQFRF